MAKRSFLFGAILIFLLPFSLRATHIIGGNLGYQFVSGPNAQNLYTYNVVLTIYHDCNSQFWGSGFPENPLAIGVYEGAVNANIVSLFQDLIVQQVENQFIDYNTLVTACQDPIQSCIFRTQYFGQLTVPFSANGYHLIYDRCCRSGTVTNLDNPGGQGDAFYAFIPSQLVQNTSPIFSDSINPAICVADTGLIPIVAFDPDGDQLQLSLVAPFRGYLTAVAPSNGLNSPQNLTLPIPQVNYNFGYSAQQVFGTSGFTSFNPLIGDIRYFVPIAGNFVATIEAREFRNGNLVGISQLEYQFSASLCSLAAAPVIIPPPGNTGTNIFITAEAGDTINEIIRFTEIEGDSMTFESAIGSAINPFVTNPPGSINPPPFAIDTFDIPFTWATSCNQSQTQPYNLQVAVRDGGCPEKIGTANYFFTLTPFVGPQQITGIQAPCAGQVVEYEADSIPNAVYNWTISGGTIVGNPKPNSVLVAWPTTPILNSSVLLECFSKNGCPSPPLSLQVTVLDFPINAGTDVVVCEGDTAVLGGAPTSPGGFTYQWSGPGQILNPTSANPQIVPNVSGEYIVTAINTNNCVKSDTVFVRVHLSDTAKGGADTVLCSTNQLPLNGAGGISYQWEPAGIFNNANIQNPIATINQPLEITVAISTLNNCLFFDTLQIETDTIPFTVAGIDTAICLNDTLSLGLVSTDTILEHRWRIAGGSEFSTEKNPLVSPTVSTTYILRSIAPSTCFSEDTILLTVNPLPNVAISNNDTTICRGDTLSLLATGALSYLWQPANRLNDPIGAKPLAFPLDSTTYIVEGIDANECMNSAVLQVFVFPRNLNLGGDLFLCPGDTVQVQGSGATSVIWTPTIGLSDSTIVDPMISIFTSTQYIAQSTSLLGCLETDTVEVVIDNRIPTDAGNDTSICEGTSFVLGGNPTSFSNVSYQWTNVPVPEDTLANPVISPLISQNYIVFTSSDTCAGIDTVFVNINPIPSYSISPDTSTCFRSPVTLGVFGPSLVEFLWSPEVFLNVPNTDSVQVIPLNDTTFFVRAIDSLGCSIFDSVAVQVLALPDVVVSNDTSICRNDSIQVFASGAISYVWSPAALMNNSTIFNPVISSSRDTLIMVEGLGTNNCIGADTLQLTIHPDVLAFAGNDTLICQGDSIRLQASGGNSYSWISGQSFLLGLNISNPIAFPDSARTFTVLVVDSNFCSAEAGIFININYPGDISVNNDTNICPGDTITLSATAVVNPTWSPVLNIIGALTPNPRVFPNSSTTYIVSGFDAAGCRESAQVRVDILPKPFVNAGGNRSLCEDQQITLGGNPSGPPNAQYFWRPSNLFSNPNHPNPIYTSNQTQELILQVIDTNNCSNRDTILAGIFDFSFNPVDTAICNGKELNVLFNYNFTTGSTTININPNQGVLNVDSTGVLLQPNQSLVYNVEARNGECVRSRQFFIDVYPSPEAQFESRFVMGCDGVRTQFENNSTQANNYTWIFNQNNQSTEENPEFVFPYDEMYNALLIASNQYECTDSQVVEGFLPDLIGVLDVDLPNVMTPNGDGLNDYFEIPFENEFRECFTLSIFNRWGNLVFQSNSALTFWDGRSFTGGLMPAGVYYYVLDVKGITKNGSITLQY